MEPRESHILSLSICQKLYDMVMKILKAQTHKTVTLGCPPSQSSPKPLDLQSSSGSGMDHNVHPRNQEEVTIEKGSRIRDDPSSGGSLETPVDNKNNIIDSSPFQDGHENGSCASNAEQEEPIPEDVPQMKGVKKSVSFQDKVETIERKKKKKIKRSKSNESFMVHSDDDQPPLQPILKVPSNVNEAKNSNS